jgi:hypothetical protein
MSDTSTEVRQFGDDVPPMIYGDVFQCWFTHRWHPEFYVASGSRYVRHTDGNWVLSPVDWLAENYRTFVDEQMNEHTVHRLVGDDDCQWCNNAVIFDHETRRAYDFRRRHDATLCNGCAEDATPCDRCNYPMAEGNEFEVGDSYWCESCYDHHTYRCEYCDDVLEEGEECECDDSACADLIQSYSTKFYPLVLHTTSDNGLLLVRNFTSSDSPHAGVRALGLEFEMENMLGHYRTSEIAGLFMDAYNRRSLMLKHDGSISDGFELVTQPHTLEAFMEHFDWDLIREAQAKGMRGWDVGSREIGIHIHINRKAFHSKAAHGRYNASPHLMAFMFFIYSNVRSITRIAGRNVHYGHMSSRYLSQAFGCAKYGHSQPSRTQAVNLLNDATVELRMFRSTMRVERVQAYLQFADAAVRWTQTDRVGKMRQRFNFADFADWVTRFPEYAQLSNLIVETDAVSFAPPRLQVPIVSDDNGDIDEDDVDNEFVVSDADIRF